MTKIVYNGCYGGFSLSRAAILLARKLSGDPKWGGVCIKGDAYPGGQLCEHDFGHIDGIERHDPFLVAAVERLGNKADGGCANLCICELPKGTLYRIDEYDGNESVVANEEYDWKVA